LLTESGLRLVVVPLDPIAAYEACGNGSFLEAYFNPGGMFDEVFAVSPLEKGRRAAFGMTIIGASEHEFTRLLRDIKPHVVRAYGGMWCSDFVCRRRVPGVPVVVSVHDSLPGRVHRSVRYADLVLCTSEAVRRQVLARGTEPGRTRLLPNRIDRTVFHRSEDAAALQAIASRFPAGRHILHVGRKTHQKNLDTLLRALAVLPPDYSVVFIGMGDRLRYSALAEQLGVGQRCFWLDAVPNDELPDWYTWCDCLCVPSRWEGFGIVFIEAAACGTAIVTSDLAPMNEFLTDGESAALVREYENPGALAETIRRVCEDASYRNRIASGATAAAEPFDRAAVDRTEMAWYREAMMLAKPGFGRRLEIRAWQTRERLGHTRQFASRAVAGVRSRLRGMQTRLRPS
jgi:glycosyltransferase involved in cell wall biosynthesis